MKRCNEAFSLFLYFGMRWRHRAINSVLKYPALAPPPYFIDPLLDSLGLLWGVVRGWCGLSFPVDEEITQNT